MISVSPYLGFEGTCEDAFKFYEQVLGAKILVMMAHAGTPMAEHVPPTWQAKILHGQIAIGGHVIMASDVPPGRYQKPQGISVSLGVDDPAEAEHMFHALTEGGSVTMPIAETFWALRFGMVTDRFGIPWLINCDHPR